jgi:ribose-phosphate pyrophosphokinase
MITINGYRLEPTIFPDKTSQVWKPPEDLLKQDVRVCWTFEHEGEFMHLAQLALLIRASGHNAELHLPYLPYARQDKNISNDATFALRAFARHINTLCFSLIHLYDPHSLVATELIRNSHAHWFTREVNALFASEGYDLVCYPDAGAFEKYSTLNPGKPSARAEKVREPLTG